MSNIGAAIGNFLGFDPTPGFNIDAHAGGGIPFISRGNGSTGIAPPAPAPAVQGATNTAPAAPTDPPSGAYSQSDAQAAADKAALDQALYGIDNGISSANDGLGRLDHQQAIGADNIQQQFKAAADALLGKRTLSDQQFNQNKTTDINDYLAARAKTADSSRAFLEGARRTLGANGAAGGSADMFALPFEAQTMAASGNQDAQTTNNKNIIALTQGHDKDQQAINNEQGSIEHQRDQGTRDLETQIQSKRADLLNTIASLTGQKSILNGGNVASASAAASPYLAKIPGILDTIDSLSATAPIAAQNISLSHPDLSGYNFAKPVATPVATQDPTLAPTAPINPVLSMLGLDPNQQQNPVAPVLPIYDPNQRQLQTA